MPVGSAREPSADVLRVLGVVVGPVVADHRLDAVPVPEGRGEERREEITPLVLAALMGRRQEREKETV